MMTQDEVESFADRMRAAKEAKAAERAEAAMRGESLEPDASPKPKRKYRKRKTTRTRTPSNKPPSLRAPVKAMLETVGSVWHMSELTRGHVPLDENYPTCGSVLLAQADLIATNLNTLAQADPTVYKWLDRMMSGGGWGGVVLATWPVAQAVLAAHVMPRLQREEPEPEEASQTWPPEPNA
jgi:hypothetical protein